MADSNACGAFENSKSATVSPIALARFSADRGS